MRRAFGPPGIFRDKMVAFNSTVTAPFDPGPFSVPGFILVFAEPQKAQSFRPISEGPSNP